MKIINRGTEYIEDIYDIAYRKYCRELENHPDISKKSESDFIELIKEKVDYYDCLIGVEKNQCLGFILYKTHEDGNELTCTIPVWGYGSVLESSEKIIGHLFQSLADQIVLDKNVNFSVRLYAHDVNIHKLFTHMQFGIISEKATRLIKEIEHDNTVEIRQMPKHELRERWDEVWLLLKQLIAHLQKSPVFYPCSEFTEDLYKEFFMDGETAVYVAENDGRIIGVIESNPENLELVFPDSSSANVGEAYVLPEYRGLQIAQALLHHLEGDLLAQAIRYDWVEHGTANPAARGFWNKYFQTFEYEFIRTILR